MLEANGIRILRLNDIPRAERKRGEGVKEDKTEKKRKNRNN